MTFGGKKSKFGNDYSKRVMVGRSGLGVREVVGSRPGRGNSKESFSSNQETGKVFSPEMPFYSKF